MYAMLRVWDVENGSQLRAIDCHTRWITDVALSADGHRVAATIDVDPFLLVWDVATGCPIRALAGHSDQRIVRLSSNGSRALTLSGDWTLKLWDMDSGCELDTLVDRQADSPAEEYWL